jgi:hypothetical protein
LFVFCAKAAGTKRLVARESSVIALNRGIFLTSAVLDVPAGKK